MPSTKPRSQYKGLSPIREWKPSTRVPQFAKSSWEVVLHILSSFMVFPLWTHLLPAWHRWCSKCFITKLCTLSSWIQYLKVCSQGTSQSCSAFQSMLPLPFWSRQRSAWISNCQVWQLPLKYHATVINRESHWKHRHLEAKSLENCSWKLNANPFSEKTSSTCSTWISLSLTACTKSEDCWFQQKSAKLNSQSLGNLVLLARRASVQHVD